MESRRRSASPPREPRPGGRGQPRETGRPARAAGERHAPSAMAMDEQGDERQGDGGAAHGLHGDDAAAERAAPALLDDRAG